MADIRNILQERLGLGLEESRVLIVGLGKTGYSVARFLSKYNIKFAIADSRNKPPFYQQLMDEMPDTPLFLGGFGEQAFSVSTHLIISPGVALIEPEIAKAIGNGARVLSDIDLFVCAIQAPVVAITGSNGKSTVTAMLGKMANVAKRDVAVGANFGTPALDLIGDSVDLYVVELSSFQLERTSLLNANVATVLNVSADHMDRHQDMKTYAYEKSKVYLGDGIKVINMDDAWVSDMHESDRTELSFSMHHPADLHVLENEQGECLAYGDKVLLPVAQMQLQGRHNIANALAALALGSAIGIPEKSMCEALKQFKGLEHRMQKVAEINGVTWVNDSKATNTGACIAALLGFSRKVVLIAGGDCKKADMSELAKIIKEKVKAVVLMGKDAGLIEKAIAGAVPAYAVASITEAVNMAATLADTGETVLLSPACASLDQFANYQERGNQFVLAVQGLQV